MLQVDIGKIHGGEHAGKHNFRNAGSGFDGDMDARAMQRTCEFHHKIRLQQRFATRERDPTAAFVVKRLIFDEFAHKRFHGVSGDFFAR